MPSPYYLDPLTVGGGDTGANWANAWLDIQSFLNVIDPADICYFRNIQTLSSIPTIARACAGARLIGVNAAGVDDGTQATLDGTAVQDCLQYSTLQISDLGFKNIKFYNPISSAMTLTSGGSAYYWTFENCTFENCGLTAVYGLSNSFQYATFNQCSFLNNLYDLYICLQLKVFNSTFIGTTNQCIYAPFRDTAIVNNIFHDIGAEAIYLNEPAYVGNNIIDDANKGIRSYSNNTMFVNNRITNCVTGVDVSTSYPYMSIYNNYFYNPGGTDILGTAYKDLGLNRLTGVNSDAGYNNVGIHDFNLTVGANGVGVPVGVGGINEATNIGYQTSGMNPAYGAGGGGGRQPRLITFGRG
jgi:hypothetical protein